MKRNLVSAISLVLLSSLAYAQDKATEETPAPVAEPAAAAPPAPPIAPNAPRGVKAEKTGANSERIQVTGSRIKQIDVETTTPVTIFSKADIDRSGAANISDFIRDRIPSGSMTTENETLQQGAGTASFGGRDFDSDYTLILVNGRRLPSNAIENDSVDLNLIPLAAVERVEYLTDGASAIYGSDAVAGVLNIITRKEFNGTSVAVRAGTNARHKDGTETSMQIVTGASTDKSNFLIAADLFKRESVKASDRPLIKSSLSPDGDDGRSPTGFPGYVRRTENNIAVTRPFNDCPASSIIGPDSIATDRKCAFDIAPLYQAIPKTERQSIYTVFDTKLNERLKFFGEARYSRSSTEIRNGAAPGQIAVTAAQWNALPDAIKAESPFAATATVPEPDTVKYVIGRRFVEFGPRSTSNYNESLNLVGGLQGAVTDDINWELAIAKHRLKNLQFGTDGNIDSAKIIDYFQNGTFDPFQLNKFNTQAQIDARDDVVTEIFRLGESDLEIYTLNFDGHLSFLLGGGAIGWSAGLESRKERYGDRSDSLSQTGNIAGSAGGVGGGGQVTQAGFAEFDFPILKTFDVKAAVRNDTISNSDGPKKSKDATTYHIGTSYAPIDLLKFRATYGTGFKAAPLHERFLGKSFGVQTIKDITYCRANHTAIDDCEDREVNTQSSGNVDLDPEKSVYWNAGVVIQPLTDLSFSIDYWNLTIDDKIGELTTQYLINNESTYGNLIHRTPAGTLDEKGFFVESPLLNLTKNQSSGLELGGSYALNLGFARLNSNLKVSKTLESRTQETPTDPLCNFAKKASPPDGPNATIGTDLLTKIWSAGAHVRYDSGVSTYAGGVNPGTCDFANPETNFHVKHYAELGLNAGYVAPWGTEFGIGVNNVTNAAPPYDRNATWPWFNQQGYSNMGRFVYASAAHKFD